MDTGKNYNKLVYGSGINKVAAQISTIKAWLRHPKMQESQKLAKRSKVIHYADFLSSMFIHGSTLEDFVVYEFYNKNHKEKKTYLTGKKQHRFFDEVNNKEKTDIFIDKFKFADYFQSYLGRGVFKLYLDGSNVNEAKKWLTNRDTVFAKPSQGIRGQGVTKLDIKENVDETIKYCLENNLDLIEELIIQHDDLNTLYPGSINTVRFMTYVVDNEVKVIGTILRMGNGGHIDNGAAGGIFATIDPDTGVINNVAFNRAEETFENHPITKTKIKGFKIPHWDKVVEMCKNAALELPDVRSIGWDVAITPEGPLLIEGNDRWCRVLWQLPAEKGLYHLIK